MIYRLISASNVIANVQDTFNVDDSDWIGRASNWLNKGLMDLGVISELVVIHHETTATDYRVELPCSIKSLEAVEIDGKRIYRSNQIRDGKTDVMGMSYDVITYTVQGDNYIQFETDNDYFQDVDVIIHFKSLPVEVFKPWDIYLPLVPDIDVVQDALALYIFIKLLGRGYKHNVFDLNSNNPATNPYLQYHGMTGKDGIRKKARIKIKSMDKDARERVSVSTRSFNHPDRHATKDFNNKL